MRPVPSEPAASQWDGDTALLVVLAGLVSVISFLIYFRNGDILLFGDAVAHINIARRVFDSRTPGLLQLGTVWLPLPHLLMIPFVVSKGAWQTGLGGSLPSMAAYVFGVLGIFRLVRGVRFGRATEWLAAGIFGLNPNLLYMQATAMTETVYLALFVWSVVYFVEFLREREHGENGEVARRASRASLRNDSRERNSGPQKPRPVLEVSRAGTTEVVPFSKSLVRWPLVKCGACLLGACLTRYDGWFVAAVMGAIVLWLCIRGQVEWKAAGWFLLLAGIGPAFWLGYNAVVYTNALEFANGPYSAKAIEQRGTSSGLAPHPGDGNLLAASSYFLKAGQLNVAEGNWGRWWLGLAAVGSLGLFFIRGGRKEVLRKSGGQECPPHILLLLWLPLPFYMFAVAYGGVPVFNPVWWPFSLYNVRYGVELLPALAVFVAVGIQWAASMGSGKWTRSAVAAAGVTCLVVSYGGVWRARPVCYQEAWVNSRTRIQLERSVGEQLRGLPAKATFLMYTGEHVGALQDAGIPLARTINEGNHRAWMRPLDSEGLWEHALAEPGKYADFAVAFEGDPVWKALHERGLPVLTIIAVNGQKRATIYQTREGRQLSPVTMRVNQRGEVTAGGGFFWR